MLRDGVVVRISNINISRLRLADYVKTKHKTMCGTCEPHVQQAYFSSFNQSNHWLLALLLPFSLPFRKLPFDLLWHDNIFAKSRTKMIMISSFFLVCARFLLLYEKNSYSQSFSTSNLKLCICTPALQRIEKVRQTWIWEEKKGLCLTLFPREEWLFEKIMWLRNHLQHSS